MKITGIMTGKDIYETVNRLQSECEEVGRACDQVADSLGLSSSAYKLLDKQYKDKKAEIDKILRTRYSVQM